jgi:hypothetical protein
MAKLLSLPNEMLVCNYINSPTVESAVSLSSVNRRLHSVWLKHTDHIAEIVPKRQIPAYQDAVDLVILEAALIDKTQLTLPTMNQFPARLNLSRLFRNAGLASSATAAWLAYVEDLEPDSPQAESLHIVSSHAAYYLMRKVVLSHRRRNKRLDKYLHSAFDALSKDAMLSIDNFLCHLTSNYADITMNASNLAYQSPRKLGQRRMSGKTKKTGTSTRRVGSTWTMFGMRRFLINSTGVQS